MLEDILNLPIAPGIEKEEDVGADNRYKLILLHREADIYTVLGVPYGADLTSKVEVPSAIYLKASPEEIKQTTILDPKISLIKHKNYSYPIIENEIGKRTIPYKTRKDFHVGYTDNRFYSYMQEHVDTFCKTLEEAFNYLDGTERPETFSSITKKAKEAFETIVKAIKISNTFPNKAYNLIEELFAEEQIYSSKMTRLERKLEHFHLKNLTIQRFPELEKEKPKINIYALKLGLKNLVKETILHPILPTYIKRNFMLREELKKEIKRKRNKEMLSAIKETYPNLFDKLKNLNNETDDRCSKSFRNLSIVTGVGTMFFNFPIGAAIASYGLLDRYFSKKHAKNEGTYTGPIGQIRDLFVKKELRDFYFFDVSKKGYLI